MFTDGSSPAALQSGALLLFSAVLAYRAAEFRAERKRGWRIYFGVVVVLAVLALCVAVHGLFQLHIIPETPAG